MKKPMQKFVWGLAVTTAALLLAAPIHAQEPVTVLLLDRNAIQANVAPNHFPAVDVNAAIADVGVRDALPFFNLREGQRLVLPGGSAGHEGWLAFTAVPSSWSTTEGNDGLENFVYAGPGLGSPDSTGSRTTLLGTKTEVVPLRAEGLRMLTGRTVCAVAFANELPRSASGVTVSGPNLGIVAFRVQGLLGDDAAALPSVELTVLETRQVCAGDLAPMIDAPVNGQ